MLGMKPMWSYIQEVSDCNKENLLPTAIAGLSIKDDEPSMKLSDAIDSSKIQKGKLFTFSAS